MRRARKRRRAGARPRPAIFASAVEAFRSGFRFGPAAPRPARLACGEAARHCHMCRVAGPLCAPHAGARLTRRRAGLGSGVTDHRDDQLRALALMIVSCRAKAMAHGVPSLIPLLDRAGLSLSRHVARTADAIAPEPTAPCRRGLRH